MQFCYVILSRRRSYLVSGLPLKSATCSALQNEMLSGISGISAEKKKKRKKLSAIVLHLHYCIMTVSNSLLQGVILVSFKTFQHARLFHVHVQNYSSRPILCFFTPHFPLLLQVHLPTTHLFLDCSLSDCAHQKNQTTNVLGLS